MHRDPAAGSKIVYKAVNPYINSRPEYVEEADRFANGKFNRKKLPFTMTVRTRVATVGSDDCSSTANCWSTVPRLTKPITLEEWRS